MNMHRYSIALLALSLFASPVFAQEAFPTPDAAGDALVQALGSTKADTARLAALLGKDWRDYIPVGSVDRDDVDAFLTRYREKHA